MLETLGNIFIFMSGILIFLFILFGFNYAMLMYFKEMYHKVNPYTIEDKIVMYLCVCCILVELGILFSTIAYLVN